MTDNSFPIPSPSPELVDQWIKQGVSREAGTSFMTWFATQAARWGSDQELEACCEWLGDAPVVYNDNGDLHPGSYLRDARRPPCPPKTIEINGFTYKLVE
jgi:hypothetical protein